MYTVFSTFLVPDDKANEVIQIYQQRSRLVDKAEALLIFCSCKMPPSGELTVQLLFETKEDYLNWARSKEFKQIHELEKKYPVGTRLHHSENQ